MAALRGGEVDVDEKMKEVEMELRQHVSLGEIPWVRFKVNTC